VLILRVKNVAEKLVDFCEIKGPIETHTHYGWETVIMTEITQLRILSDIITILIKN
jgi:hypothetical protein